MTMRPVYRSKEHQSMIDLLISREYKDPDTNVAIFAFIKDLQCYAALLGFEKGIREKFERGNKAESIGGDTFDSGWHEQCLYLIAVAETGSMKILNDDSETNSAEDMITIFEEYAHAGFDIMQRWLKEKPSDIYGVEAIIQGLKNAGFLKRPKIETEFTDPEF